MTVLDVIVVGGGVIGSSIAFHLARSGARVRVYEQAAPAVQPSASWASAGGVRQQRRDPREWPLTLEAARRWPQLDAELGASTGFVQGGHLHLVERQSDVAALQAAVEREADAGMQIRMLDEAELRSIAPFVKDGVCAASFTPADGQADPRRTTAAFASAAQAHGADYRTGVRVDELIASVRGVSGVRIGSSTVEAERVVVAAGVWTAALLATIGIELPVQPRAPQMLLTTAAPPLLGPTLSATNRPLSLKQLPTGEFFIGGGWPTDIVDIDGQWACVVREESVAGSWAVATDIMPALARQRVTQSWGGLEAESIDGVPFLGELAEVPRAFIAVGFSGHGFQLSPAVGRAVADALGGRDTPELEPLAASRIRAFTRSDLEEFSRRPTGEPLRTIG